MIMWLIYIAWKGVKMKAIIVSTVALLSMLLSLNASADRFLLTGKPAELISNMGFYSFPSTYIAGNGYHFVRLLGTDRVCFLNKKPEYSSLNMMQITLSDHGQQLPWNCYVYDSRFFEIDF
jgi:hypothetical protein